ncbi:MAG: class I SAM-dependent RNA methyltransferase [Halocynthiibacter sp.]
MTYKIQALNIKGQGLVDGYIAPMTLPGEEIDAVRIDDILTDIKILTPSSDRVKPSCSHYKSCGGCSLMHASDEFVAEWKRSFVQKALSARDIDVIPVMTHVSGANTRRRAALSARRTKKGALIGFHTRAADTIIDVPNCQLLAPAIKDAMPALKELVLIGGSRKGEMTLTVTDSLGGLDVAVEGGKDLDNALLLELTQSVLRLGFARLSWNGEVLAEVSAPLQSFSGVKVNPPSGAFLQATKQAEEALTQAVLGFLDGCDKVTDLFAGSGTFSLSLAKSAEVHAIEGSKDMIAVLDRGWREGRGLKHVRSEARDLFRRPLLPDEFKNVDGIVIDPPRAGAAAQISEISKTDVPRIAMVSCNPVTFARDAQVLIAAGWALEKVDVVDQFRWSTHVECLGYFQKS